MNRKKKIKIIYNLSAFLSRVNGNKSSFMNLGYLPSVDNNTIELDALDEKYRLYIQMYTKLLEGINVSGKDVLEVACGRGGGTAFISKNLNTKSMLGTDFSSGNIRLCKKKFGNLKNLEFIVQDAENLNNDMQFFDVILNLESFMFYNNKQQFLKGVHSKLRPGGFLCLASPLNEEQYKIIQTAKDDLDWTLVLEDDITEGVCASIRKRYETQDIPKLKKRQNFEVSLGSGYYKKLVSGENRYTKFIFQCKN